MVMIKQAASNKMKNIALILIVLFAFMLVSGQTGCEMTPPSTASKTGVDFNLVSGVGKLSSGKTLSQGDTFSLQVHIENYDKEARNGEICIRDDIDKESGGIETQCMPFFVKAAEVIEEKKSSLFGAAEKIQPSTAEIFFPTSGEYSYNNMHYTQKANAYVTLKYSQTSVITALEGIKVPVPETEMIKLTQEAAPVKVTVEKSIAKIGNTYKINLEIQLSKQALATLYSQDFKEENYISFRVVQPQSMTCEPSGTYDKAKFMQGQGLVELKNTKFIKCSSMVDITEQQQYSFEINLNYGVKIEKEIPFTIEVK